MADKPIDVAASWWDGRGPAQSRAAFFDIVNRQWLPCGDAWRTRQSKLGKGKPMTMPACVYIVTVTNGDPMDPTSGKIAERICKTMCAAQNFGITKCDELWKQTGTTAFDDFQWTTRAIDYIDN